MDGDIRQANVRGLALEVLIRAMEQGAFLNTALNQIMKEKKGLAKRDRAFLSRLANGTMERKMELDYVIGSFSNVPVKKVRPILLDILRMGVYQILYMEQVPVSAACNESVKLAKKKGFGSLSGYVNGVLRNVARNKDNLTYPDKKTNPAQHYSIRYSVPEWLVSLWLEELGEPATKAMLEASLQEGAITVRCNTKKIGLDVLRQAFEKAGVTVQNGRYHPLALRLTKVDSVASLPGFQEGWFQVQDESSMLVTTCAGIRKGWRILDVCAAPGGKALHAAQVLQGAGRVTACDLTEGKLNRIRDNLQRLGFDNIELVRQDALETRVEWLGKMDLVIADLPCSGLGVMGKKVDVKYRITPDDLTNLQALQRNILTNVSRYVRPGGILLYSTCTVHRGENEENASWIVKNLPFSPESLNSYLPEALHGKTTENGYVQFIPGIHACDGFFLSRFRKIKNNP